MCGIAGLLDRGGAPAPPDVVERMTTTLAHRGPDGAGIWCEGPVGLGHRRLAIIDLSPAAAQPMRSADGRFVITYNGEVYNFRELRSELEALGRRFRSSSDTEVVLEALAHWGTDAIKRFNGMFALALWDAERRELLLARDRYGTKPLYYTKAGNKLIFGSEVKAILQHPDYRVGMDREALVEYFTFQNFFTDRTLFKNVRLLPAGCWLKLSARDGREVLHRYWDFDFREPRQRLSEADYVEEVDRLMRQALTRQLVSDVELGSYLSGGMDSGTLTALASRQLPYIKTFTAGFDLRSASGIELGFDERAQAERISYLYKTEHYEIVLKAGDMERCLPRLVWHLEEPRVGQSYPNFYISQLASKFCKVVLAGTGGDELFGGYPWRYVRFDQPLGFEDFVDRYYLFWQRLIPNTEIWDVFAPIKREVEHVWTRDIFRDVFTEEHRAGDGLEGYVNHSLYFEAKTFLNGLLVVEDKLSMAHGLETRVPFLDNDLVDFAMQVPVSMKLSDVRSIERLNENEPGLTSRRDQLRRRDGKQILRKAMRRYMPEDITDGEKQGFSGPDASWFRGESIDFVRKILMQDDKAAIFEFLDRDAVRRLVSEHLEGRRNRRLLIWSLLMVEYWCRTFLDGAVPAPADLGR
jgi:asparagine synthase (glutamine-hydrolysing)